MDYEMFSLKSLCTQQRAPYQKQHLTGTLSKISLHISPPTVSVARLLLLLWRYIRTYRSSCLIGVQENILALSAEGSEALLLCNGFGETTRSLIRLPWVLQRMIPMSQFSKLLSICSIENLQGALILFVSHVAFESEAEPFHIPVAASTLPLIAPISVPARDSTYNIT